MSEKEIWECLDKAFLNMVQKEKTSQRKGYIYLQTLMIHTHTHTHTHTQAQHFSLHYLRCFLCVIITDGWGNNINKVLIQLHNAKEQNLINIVLEWIDSPDNFQQLNNRSQMFSSVQFGRSVVSSSLRPHELQHARPPCPSQTPGVYSNSCPLSWRCNPANSSSVLPCSSCPQPLPASGSFPMSQLFAWGGQSTGVWASASVLPMNTRTDLL